MSPKRRLHVVLLAILALGVALRLGYVATLPNERIQPDEFDYFDAATHLLQEGSFDRTVYHHVPPVVPVLNAGLFFFTGPSFLAARVLQALLFVAIGLVLYLLGREVGGAAVGLLAAAFAAVYPYFIYWSGYALTETAATLVISAVMLFGVRAARTARWLDVAGFGVLLALASLTRAACLYFVLSVPLVFAIAWGVKTTRWLVASAVACSMFLGAYLPWVAVNRAYFGELLLSPTIGSGILIYRTSLNLTMPDPEQRRLHVKQEVFPKYYYPEGATHKERLEGDNFLRQEGLRVIRQDIGGYIRIVGQNLSNFWALYPRPSNDPVGARIYKVVGLLSFGVLTPFFGVGLWISRARFRRLAVLYGFLAYFTIVHSLLFAVLRYRIPMDGIVMVFAAGGLVAVVARCAPTRLQRSAVWLGAGTSPEGTEWWPGDS